ncbi:MAG: ribose-5-phosphate isomerase RpiA [Planctomycetaceae bacterium]|nr:ribose-5-phosphate isomerase RpiA [Planctomycetaceae bacterium]
MAEQALALVRNGNVVGLGSGRAATAFIEALGERVRQGLQVRGVPTSQESADFSRRLGIPLVDPAEVVSIDIDVDGADEVDPQCNLIKGLGGALLREKIVAAASKQVVILVGSEKLVPVLGTRGKLPVEVVPFGVPLCTRRLAALGCIAHIREQEGRPFVTDNGNHILDCAIGLLDDAARLDADIRAIPGVVGTGLFLQIAQTVLIQHGDQIQVRKRPA